MNRYMIRSASPEDAEKLLGIYSYYVEQTAISFEYVPPSLEEFRSRIDNTLKEFPYLVIEENGIIRGYVYEGRFNGRAAYSHCCELSIYIDRDSRGKGFGRMLYEAVEKELLKKGIKPHKATACLFCFFKLIPSEHTADNNTYTGSDTPTQACDHTADDACYRIGGNGIRAEVSHNDRVHRHTAAPTELIDKQWDSIFPIVLVKLLV